MTCSWPGDGMMTFSKRSWMQLLKLLSSLPILLLITFSAAWGQQFLAAPEYTATASASVATPSVTTADFNHDGKDDMAVRNSVLLSNGDGTFRQHVEYMAGFIPESVTSGDFNEDGNPDLAITAFGISTSVAAILLGNGDGTFQPHRDFPTVFGPLGLVVGDFNGDGHQDIVIADSQSSTISVLLGKGDGTFRSQMNFAVNGFPGSVAAADFNDDGILDLAIPEGGANTIGIFLGNGDGSFRFLVEYALNGPAALVVGDFNGDHKPDLAWINSPDGFYHSVGVMFGNQDGTFQTGMIWDAGPDPIGLAVGDFDQNGRVDLAVTNSKSSTVNILVSNPDGSFQAAIRFGVGESPLGVGTGDFNGDGKTDLAAATSEGVTVLINSGRAQFRSDLSFAAGHATSAVAVADFNGDGRLDVATANGAPFALRNPDDTVSVLLGNGDGTFQARNDFGVGHFPQSVAAGDFNGDGKVDLATADHDNNTVSVLLGNGDGTFRPRSTFACGSLPTSVAVADLNADGKLDLAVADNGGAVSILLGKGDGTFNPSTNYNTGNAPFSIAIGDFNGDHRPDLVVGAGSVVSVLLGNGDGSFQTHVDYTTAGNPLAIAIGDFNRDGVNDLAVADDMLRCGPLGCTRLAGMMTVLLGKGDGTFHPPESYPILAHGPSAVAVADFNGDGTLDVVLASPDFRPPDGYFGATVSLFWGKGDGTFRPPLDYTTGFGPTSLTAGDFNGDNQPDVAVAVADGDAATIFLNNGTMGQYVLSLQSVGGRGDLSMNPGNIECSACTAAFNNGITVSLSAAPSADFSTIFQNWAGDCTGSASCSLQMSADHSVIANYVANSNSTLSVNKGGSGRGTVFAQQDLGGIQCGSTCSASYPTGTTVGLGVEADAGSVFAGWSGTGCGAGNIDCFVTVNSDQNVTAIFNPGPAFTLTVNLVGGPGTVAIFAPVPTIICTSTCTNEFAPGTTLQLDASPSEGISFSGWSGAGCSGSFACGLVMNSDLTVTATFSGGAPDFSISSSGFVPSALSPGQSADARLSAIAIGGFNSTVSFACSVEPLPPLAPTCSVHPTSANPGESVTVTVRTTAPTSAVLHSSALSGWFYASWLPAIIGVWREHRSGQNRRWVRMFLLSTVLLAGASLQVACGGKSSTGGSGGTPLGTYTATVTGTSGTLQHSSMMKFTVQ